MGRGPLFLLLLLLHGGLLACTALPVHTNQPGWTDVVVCEAGDVDVVCPGDDTLVFGSAVFGPSRGADSGCEEEGEKQGLCQAVSVLHVLYQRCFNSSSCRLDVHSLPSPCPAAVNISLHVTYTCKQDPAVWWLCEEEDKGGGGGGGSEVTVSGSGLVVSPGYPGHSPAGVACTLTLLPPPGSTVLLQAVSLTQAGCETRGASLYCGNSIPLTHRPLSLSENASLTWTTSNTGNTSSVLLQYTVYGCSLASLPRPYHAYVTEYSSIRELVYSCLPGYKLTSQHRGRFICQNGTWEGDPVNLCEEMTCTHPGIPSHGSAQPVTSLLLIGQEVIFSCDPGFFLSHNVSSVCMKDGSVSSLPPECLRVDCGPPPLLPHGTLVLNDTGYGAEVMYTCDEGYKLGGGSATTICQQDGTWNGTAPTCNRISCETLTTIPNGQVWFSVEDGINTAYYTCIDGFRIHGDATRKCQTDGKWSGTPPDCTRIVCRHPGIPTNGSADPGHISDYPIGTTVSFRCFTGYRLIGNQSITCTELGNWVHPVPTCEIVDCGAPPSQPHADTVFSTTVYPSETKFICYPGYQPANPRALLKCAANGTWEGTLPMCQVVPTTEVVTTTRPTTIVPVTTETTTCLTSSSSSTSSTPHSSPSSVLPWELSTSVSDSSPVTNATTYVKPISTALPPLPPHTTSTNMSHPKPRDTSSGVLRTEAIAGIAVGSVVVFFLLAGIAFMVFWRSCGCRDNRKQAPEPETRQSTGREDSVTEQVEGDKNGKGYMGNGAPNHHPNHFSNHNINHHQISNHQTHLAWCPHTNCPTACMAQATPLEKLGQEDTTEVSIPGGVFSTAHQNQGENVCTVPSNGHIDTLLQNIETNNHRLSSSSSTGSIKALPQEDGNHLSVHSIPSSTGSSPRTCTQL